MGRASFHTTRMKANLRSRSDSVRSLPLAAFSTALLAGLLAGCVPPAPHSTTGTTTQTRHRPDANRPTPPVSNPAPTYAPTASPMGTSTPVGDWRNIPATPGNWVFSSAANSSVSTFANGLFSIRCNRGSQSITINRQGAHRSGAISMGITTTNTNRALVAQSTPHGIEITLSARDPLLDAMAVSRGRFMIAVTGEQPLYIPSWTEVTRVIEDCR